MPDPGPSESFLPFDRPVHLRAAGVSVLLVPDDGMGRLVHWGPDLGNLTPEDLLAVGRATAPQAASGLTDEPPILGLIPLAHTGFLGTPGLAGHRAGTSFAAAPVARAVRLEISAGSAAAPEEGADPAAGKGPDTSSSLTVAGEEGAGLPDPSGTPRLPAPDTAATPAPDTLTVLGSDTDAGLEVAVTIRIHPGGLVSQRIALTNTAPGPYTLSHLTCAFPVPAEATQLLDTTGRHNRENQPQRHDLTVGTHVRANRTGRTGHEATALLAAGTPGFGFETGQVWAIHVAWSGSHVHLAERTAGAVQYLAGGELLEPGEIVLEQGQAYTTPWVHAAWGRGLNEVAARFHTLTRSAAAHPDTPRPVTLNTWEAVYFHHDLAALTALADVAASVGVERFVLDDGWFTGRRDDAAGLGDWQVDPAVWPGGLDPLIDHVRARGMTFGLWVEPEMISPDSNLARAHPEWILGPHPAPAARLPRASRRQQVLDLACPPAFDHVLACLDALLDRYAISYLKWDHNRDLSEAGHRAGPTAGEETRLEAGHRVSSTAGEGPGSEAGHREVPTAGRAAVHDQTLAYYRLLDTLRARHPRVEIESCASGGGRIDLEVLTRVQRVWTSDCIDALERQTIQAWTGLLVPPEYLGAHVGAPRSHTTGRTADLSFQAGTALFAHMGIEWDLREAGEEQLTELRAWCDLYKAHRDLVHTGRTIRADDPDPGRVVHGVLDATASRALFAVVRTAACLSAPPPALRLPGLDPARRYRLTTLEPAGSTTGAWAAPAWLTDARTTEGALLPGVALGVVGLAGPDLQPEHLLLLAADAVD